MRQKLRLLIMVTVTAALLCACASVLAYDRFGARERTYGGIITGRCFLEAGLADNEDERFHGFPGDT